MCVSWPLLPKSANYTRTKELGSGSVLLLQSDKLGSLGWHEIDYQSESWRGKRRVTRQGTEGRPNKQEHTRESESQDLVRVVVVVVVGSFARQSVII